MLNRKRGRHVQPVPRRRVAAFAKSTLVLLAVVLVPLVQRYAVQPDEASVAAPVESTEDHVEKALSVQAVEADQEPVEAVVEPVEDEQEAEALEGAETAQEIAGRLVVPQVGIDAPLLSYALSGGIADPPTWDDAYVVQGYGSPSDLTSGTSYVLVHSGYRGQALGDLLTDTGAEESRLEAGDRFFVDGTEFEVVSEARYTKDDLEGVDASGVPLVPQVWEDVDGRLVLMTCLQRTQGRSVEVVVVTAQAVV